MSNNKSDQAALAAFPVADAALSSRLVGYYSDGGTLVSWFKSSELDGRRWELVSTDQAQADQDMAEARRYLALPALIDALADVEIKLDAALNPTFSIDMGDALDMLNEAHAQLRGLLGMLPVAVEDSHD